MAGTVKALATLVGGEVHGDAELRVSDVQTIEKAGPADAAYAGDDIHFQKLKNSQAGLAIISRSLAKHHDQLTSAKAVFIVDDATAAALKIVAQLRPQRPRKAIGRSTQAVISPSAVIGEGTNIHPGCVIGDDVRIGANCEIHANVVLGDGCVIENDVILYPNCTLYAGCLVRNRAIVHAGCVIGCDGFGYKFAGGKHNKLPHYGSVCIEEDVEIGANSTIDRSMIGVTVIGQGTKIDNLCQVAHNVTIGKHNIFAAQVGVAGSVVTGNYCIAAGQAGIADHVHLSDHVVLGAKAAAHRNLESGRYHGIPVLPEKEALRIHMLQQKLPDMKDQIKQLERQMQALTAQVAALNAGLKEAA